MRTKNSTFSTIIMVMITFIVMSNKPQIIKAPITNVKVFLNSALITHNKNIKITSGLSKIAFIGLASSINSNKINLRNFGNAEILKLNLIQLNDSTDFSFITDEIKYVFGNNIDSLILINNKIQDVKFEINSLELEKNMLLKNDEIITSGRIINVNELKITTEFYKNRYQAINTEIIKLKNVLRKNKSLKAKLLADALQIDSEFATKASIIIVDIRNPNSEFNSNVELSYIANGAGWIPIYDIYASNNKTISLKYNSKILNNTGINWINQTITLSTSNPFDFYSAPKIDPIYIEKNNANSKVKKIEKEIINSDQEEINIPDKEILFNTSKKYDFISGQNPTIIEVTNYEFNPEYIYKCVPKKEEVAYSIARIKDWEKLNLLDGEANIYNNGNYLGRMEIIPNLFEEYFEIPLDIVNSIYIKHKLLSSFSETKTLLGQIQKTQEFEIKIKNTSTEKIIIEVLDQIPVSEEYNVKSQIINITEGFTQDLESGEISWNLEIDGNSEKTIKLKYSITYPQKNGYNVNNNYKFKGIRAKF